MRLGMISFHASPTAIPGSGPNGGMNVYVRYLASHLARLGNECHVFTRQTQRGQSQLERIEPGFWLHRLPAGPRRDLSSEESFPFIQDFADSLMRYLHSSGLDLDFVHANYWLSGIAAHRVKHQFKIPLITTFHTLERAKLAHGTGFGSFSKLRIHQEQRILGCSDAVLVSGGEEARWLRDLYGAEPSKLVVVPLGIDRAYFSPGDCAFAKQALGIDDRTRLIVYVGRIQPLKGTYLAVEALSKLEPNTRLVIVGGPSGVEGDAEMRKIKKLIASEHLKGRVDFVHPQPHELLATYYRAADVCVVPSESETFGLVALESSACGTPVVATDVGGLRSIVEPGHTGILVNERSADAFAKAIRFVLDNPIRARAMGKLASRRADRFTWRESALRLVAALEGLEESADFTHGFSCA